MNLLSAIGNTKLVHLGISGVRVKLEFQNPTGSMKDRMALGLIEAAEKKGLLKPGTSVVEYTGGSTGASLALVCAAKGYPIEVVTASAFSQEKRDQMAALGARVTLVPYDGKGITRQLILNMIEEARNLSRKPNVFWANQIENPDTMLGYTSLGEEIWEQTQGKVDAFVQSVGSAASLNGVAKILKSRNPNIKIFAVEPAESPVLSGGYAGAHDIEGIAIGRIPTLWNSKLVDDVITVKTSEAKQMARQLARTEGLFAGTSSGGNVLAATRAQSKLGAKANVVTLLVDSGLKYLSTDLYKGLSEVNR